MKSAKTDFVPAIRQPTSEIQVPNLENSAENEAIEISDADFDTNPIGLPANLQWNEISNSIAEVKAQGKSDKITTEIWNQLSTIQ